MSLVSPAHATAAEMPLAIQQVPGSQLSTAADTPGAFTYWIPHAHLVANIIGRTVPAVAHIASTISAFCRARLLSITLWTLSISLMVIFFAMEQEPSPMRIWLAICLAFSWLIPISLQLYKLVRKFQVRGRIDAFIVTTAMLSFVFIKAFAILGGYSLVALIRVPPCFTLAAWIASHWCNPNAAPELPLGGAESLLTRLFSQALSGQGLLDVPARPENGDGVGTEML